ncbi:MAG: hypothetical protein EOO44_06135, partial [Flavobacterium sp.]
MNSPKKILCILILFISTTIHSQSYFPNLDNIFLTNTDDESVFSKDLNYLRDFFKASTKPVFYSNLQTGSRSRDVYGTESAFYGLDLISTAKTSYPLLKTGIDLAFVKGTVKNRIPIPVTFEDAVFEENNILSGKGHLFVIEGGITLDFPNTMILEANSKVKKNVAQEKKCQFVITKVNYEITPQKFTAEIIGSFNTLIKFAKNKKKPKSIENIILEATKEKIV